MALPVRLVGDKWLVRINVGSRGLDFILDSGDTAGITLQDSVLRSLGLKSYASYSNGANAGRFLSREAIVPEMRVGDLTMHDVAITTLPALGLEGGDFRAVGLLGFDFLADVVAALDYQHGTATATLPEGFAAPSDPDTYAIPVRVGTQGPITDVRVDGALGEHFMIDTGGFGGVMFTDYFARRYPEVVRRAIPVENRGYHFGGVGGGFEAKPYRFASVQIANIDFQNFTAWQIVTRRAYASDMDGTIGPDFLKYFTVSMDYGDSTFYLVPNDLGRRYMHATVAKPKPAPLTTATPAAAPAK